MREPISGLCRAVAHRGILEKLLDSRDVGLIEFRGGDGLIMAILTSFANPRGWVFTTRIDQEFIPAALSSGYKPEDLHTGEPGKPGRVRIFSSRGELALDTCGASVVELYRRDNKLSVLFNKQFNNDMWIYANEHDKDWRASKIRLGYPPDA
jgi:hypothetical protein